MKTALLQLCIIFSILIWETVYAEEPDINITINHKYPNLVDDPVLPGPQVCPALFIECPGCPDNIPQPDFTICKGQTIGLWSLIDYTITHCIEVYPDCCTNDCTGGCCDYNDIYYLFTNCPDAPFYILSPIEVDCYFHTKFSEFVIFEINIPGTYYFQLYHSNSGDYDNVTIHVLNTPQPFISSPSEILLCLGSQVTLNPNGDPSFTYDWTPSAGLSCNDCPSPVFTATAAGQQVYEVVVSNSAGCSTNSEIVIDISSDPAPSASTSATNPTCSGIYADGTATATATGGASPYGFKWNNGQTNSTATGLDAGNYFVTVTDANGCTNMAVANLSFPFTFDCDNCTIYADQTWSAPLIRVKGNLTIMYGTLTIENNTIVEFFYDNNGNAGIKLEDGKLVVNNSTLTGCNDGVWEGISGSGFNTGSYNVELNNSTIKNSSVGINGCQVKAANTTFLNNKVALSNGGLFIPFPLPGHYVLGGTISTIENSTFEYNSSSPLEMEAFIELTLNQGMKLRGNTFINTTPGSFAVTDRGYGIVSIDASYTVEPTCNVMCTSTGGCTYCCGTPNKFENLYYGIYGINSDFTLPVTIRGRGAYSPEFKNCWRGILLRGVDYATVVENEFTGGNTAYDFIGYGLYLDWITGFEVEENKFYGNYQAGDGVIINQTNSNGDNFYRNEFTDIEIATKIQGNNPNLQVKCNTYTSPISFADIGITSSGVLNDQGSCANSQTPAGNTFSHTCPVLTSDIFVSSAVPPFTYNHHNDASRTPQCYNNAIIDLNSCLSIPFSAQSCPSKLTSSICTGTDGWEALKVNITAIKADIAIREEWLANGDGQTIIDLIHQNKAPGQVEDTIIAVSPYASDRVLLAALTEKPTKLPAGIIKEILIANSPLTDTVKNILQTLNLPKGIMGEINNYQAGINPRITLEKEIVFLKRELVIAVNDVIRVFLNSPDLTREQKLDSVKTVMKIEGIQIFKCRAAAIDVIKGDTVAAREKFEEAHPDGNLDNFCKLYKILLELKRDGRACCVVPDDSSRIATIRAIAQDYAQVGTINARAILELIFKERYPEVIEPLTMPSAKMANLDNGGNAMQEFENTINNNAVPEKTYFKIYPNPASDKIIVEFNFLPNNILGELKFYDIFGRKYEINLDGLSGDKTIDVEEWNNGLYYYCVVVNNNTIARDKIIINK